MYDLFSCFALACGKKSNRWSMITIRIGKLFSYILHIYIYKHNVHLLTMDNFSTVEVIILWKTMLL